ncbi:DUF6427 family protein [Bacteroidota bacterium]
MLANFFEKTKPLNSIVLGGLFCLIYFIIVLSSENLGVTVFFILKLFGFLLLHFLFLLLSGQNFIKFGVTKNNLYAPFIMILSYGMFPNALQMDLSAFVILLIVLFYGRITSFINKDNLVGKIFDSSLVLGLAIPFFNLAIFYALVLFVAVIIFSNHAIRKFIISFVGFVVPSLFFFAYCFVTDTMSFFYEQYQFILIPSYELFEGSQVSLVVLGSLLLVSLFTNFVRIIAISNHYRLHYIITLTMLVVGVLILCLNPVKSDSLFLFLFIPISLMVSQFVESISKIWLKEACLGGLLLFSFLNLFL